ncbi:efflux RND transporter periplasmic adaptor subunit [Cellvibrio sp. KY-GH-1]|uniref:efflux RND transporter periplasmic adaptor subunit n=1 Tax=Cellvibrio sp. KY-GH-1 TaxID=2303332 RepID=UPI001246E40E|nr:efflux RND transporter periplasmic adaptor subunit [Cellvibrio sp. KY-GH-1]QEY15388.1 efflux RND transporter periplasmic adaptor subunit [Cellvibrio sp. KY-GH-1]
MRSRIRFRSVLLVSLLGLVLSACDEKNQAAKPAGGPVEVGVVPVIRGDVPLEAELPGRTNAFRKAEVRPQVSGIIQKRLFTEGSVIKAGMPLYQIDPSSYEAALSSAKAELARAEANLAAAVARESRYKSLVAIKAISQQEYDDALATLGQSKAGVQVAKAGVTTAKINLDYTRVLAPIDGVIGKSNVTEGALVNAGQADVLAEIQQVDPIYVDVSQSADQLVQLRRQMAEGSVAALNSAKVRLLLGDGTAYEHIGSLQFAEVGVNESTGTVILRAQFPNPDRLLLPGMFVRTTLEEGIQANAMLVSQRGVTRDRTGNATAMIVNKERVVEVRNITVARTVGDQWLVLTGLDVGDQVIVEGLQKAKPGAPAKAVAAASSKIGE